MAVGLSFLLVLAVAFRLCAAEQLPSKPTDVSIEVVPALTAYYYFNEITGMTQFEDPGNAPLEDEAGSRYWLSATGERLTEEPRRTQWAWIESWSEQQRRPFFFNQVTKESRWDRPSDLGWRKLPIPRDDQLDD